jgi:hypothetical protein
MTNNADHVKVRAALDQAVASAKSTGNGTFEIPAHEWITLVMAVRSVDSSAPRSEER